MRAYAETRGCRRNLMLNYFGDGAEGDCGTCDTDLAADRRPARARSADVPFELNSRVRHAIFGEGTVQLYDAGGMTVLFDKAGYKTLDVAHALAEQLLKPVPA